MNAPHPRIAAPLWLLAELTYRCPLHCAFCYNPVDYTRQGAELSTDEWFAVMRQARVLGAAQLGFSGGEPLVREDLEELVGEGRRLGFYTNLLTSGVGLTEARLARMKELGLDHIQLSFQDSTREMNDFLSNTKTFDLKARVARLIKQYDYPMVLNVVLHRFNLDHVGRIIEMALEMGVEYLELANTQYYGWGLLNRIDDEAARIGAVNTVVREADGSLTGYNTDAPGFLEPVTPLLGDEDYRFAYVIGTGGAARAIIDALFHAEFMIWSISRNPAKAKAEFGHYLGDDPEFLIDLAELPSGPLRPADPEVFSLIVNATPLGMTGHDRLDLPWGEFLANATVYDIVTAPVDTALLQQARAQGLATIDGLAMLIGQAAVAFEKFFGAPAPRGADAELRSLLTK